MAQSAALSPSTQNKFVQLADLLEKASRLARELSHTSLSIPKLERPAVVPEDEEWFWTEDWQAGERAANEDLRAGRYQTFATVKELLNDLHAQV
jgi:hypothetical protein